MAQSKELPTFPHRQLIAIGLDVKAVPPLEEGVIREPIHVVKGKRFKLPDNLDLYRVETGIGILDPDEGKLTHLLELDVDGIGPAAITLITINSGIDIFIHPVTYLEDDLTLFAPHFVVPDIPLTVSNVMRWKLFYKEKEFTAKLTNECLPREKIGDVSSYNEWYDAQNQETLLAITRKQLSDVEFFIDY